ncbi:hypothetical protein MLD52_20550 [Puniceicoccaceae bacterium K14]|nr:hypothetical protein [Puniceicoccaceae bacterium K14]
MLNNKKISFFLFFFVSNIQLFSDQSVIESFWKAKTILNRTNTLEIKWAIDNDPNPIIAIERRLRTGPKHYNLRTDMYQTIGPTLNQRTYLNTSKGTVQIENGIIEKTESPIIKINIPDLQAAYEQATWKTPAPGSSWKLEKDIDYFGHDCTRITFNYPLLEETVRKRIEAAHRNKALSEGRPFDANLFFQISKAIYYISQPDNFIVGYETYTTDGECTEAMRILEYTINKPMDAALFDSETIAKKQTN